MSAVDLHAEFAAALGTGNAAGRRWERLRARGIGVDAWVGGGPVGSARIAVEGDRYVPDPRGARALVLPAMAGDPFLFDPDGLIDLVAFALKR